MKQLSIFVTYLFFSFFLLTATFSQDPQKRIERLYIDIEEISKPEEKLDSMKKLMVLLESVDVSKGLDVYKKAVDLLPQIKDPKERFYILEMTLAYCQAYQLDPDYGKSIIPQAKNLAAKHYEDSENLISILMSEASYKIMDGNLQEAMNIYGEITELARQEENIFVEAANDFQIAYLYYSNFNYEEADVYFKKGLKLIKKVRPVSRLTKDWEARINQFLGLNLQSLNPPQVDSSLLYTQEGFRIWDSLSMVPFQRAQASYYLGSAYSKNQDYEEAQKYLREAFEISALASLQSGVMSSSSALTQLFLDLPNTDSARKYMGAYEESLIGLAPNPYNELSQNLYRSRLAYGAGSYKKAYDLFDTYIKLKDSLFSQEKQALLSSNLVKYRVAEKEKELAEQELEIEKGKNRRNQILIFGVILIAGIGLLFTIFLNRQQQRKREAEFALAQEQAETDRLRELDQLKTDFFTNISHELRTPLTLILSPTADALEQSTSRVMKEKLQTIQKNGQRLMGLVNEIMDLSKVEAGKMEIYTSIINLQELSERIFFSFESLAELRRVGYKANIDLTDTFVEGDREKLEKILNNLLSNALKYTPNGGKVLFEASMEGDTFVWRVKDSGPGISLEEQKKIFDRFYQVQDSFSSLQGGTGVGLALSKELAELLGGKIELKSEVGKGSTFQLSLPLKKVKAEDVPHLETVEEDLGRESLVFAPIMIKGEKPKILIVEDNPQLGKYLIQLLEKDHQCVLASDGKEALKQLRLNTFDLILSDVMMPNMDGFELREKINENKEWKRIPFVLLTARHLETDRIKGFQLGIDDYLTKPFSKMELLARIHNLIKNKLEREAYVTEEGAGESKGNVDQETLKKLETIVIQNLNNPQFGVESLASEFNYSSKQTRRIIKELTGLTTVSFILEVRLQKARELLQRRQVSSVVEAQLEVGIESASYFTRKFTERFGINPKEVGKLA